MEDKFIEDDDVDDDEDDDGDDADYDLTNGNPHFLSRRAPSIVNPRY